MTLNGVPGTPSAVSWDGERLDVFARAVDDTLLHVWRDGPDGGAESLGGRLAGDPVAVALGPRVLHVFGRSVGGWLLHWSWDEARAGMAGPVERRTWRVVYDPVAVRFGTGIDVYARSATDDLRRWRIAGVDWSGPEIVLQFQFPGRPAVLVRSEVPDVLWRQSDGTLGHWGLVYDRPSNSYRLGQETLGGPLASDPVAVAWAPFRMDILGARPDGTGLHWGFSGDHERWDPVAHIWRVGIWYGPELTVESPYEPGGVAVSDKRDRADIFVRSEAGELHQWSWDPSRAGHPLIWAGPTVVGQGIGSGPSALVRGGRLEAYAWNRDGNSLVQFAREEQGWTRQEFPVTVSRAVNTGPLDRVRPDVHYVLRRAADLFVAGISWVGYDLVDGEPPTLRRTAAHPRLALVFPPQHIGEETWRGHGPPVPTLDPSTTAGFDTWRATLSGPSQLVFEAIGETVELTTEGVLRALHDAPLLPFDTAVEEAGGQPQTSIELPWQLFTSPGIAISRHAAGQPQPVGDTAGLWRAHIASPAPDVAPTLTTLRSGGADPFPLPLDSAARALIRAQPTPARLDRLELSALGGTLSARGSWPGVEWDHDAAVGRDQKVRVQIRGLLYPFGHRAEYTEITERFGAAGDQGPIAVLRTQRLLTITQSVRDVTEGDATAARVFPFHRAEITVRQIDDLDDPDDPNNPGWVTFLRKPREPAAIVEQLARLEAALANVPTDLFMLHGPWIDRPPPVEDLIHALDDFLADGGDPESSEAEAPTEWQSFAGGVMDLVERIQRMREQIEALVQAREAPVPWYFFPRRAGAAIRFPVRCEGAGGTVELRLPLLFVADSDLPETEIMTAFDSLEDADASGKFAEAWSTENAGVVAVSGVPIDLVRAPVPKQGDVLVVNRLNVFGEVTAGRTFRARLGKRGGGPADWAFDVDLPATRALLPARAETHQALLRYSDAYEAAGAAEDIAFAVVGDAVDIDFTTDADRSGGLIAPRIRADGLSRANGLVNTDGLRTLDPTKLFGEGATLLGFPITSLLDHLPHAPEIVTDLSGPQPIVRMTWPDVPLSAHAPFLPVVTPPTPDTPLPMLQLTVRSSGSSSVTECHITDFALAFPEQAPLLKLTFGMVGFRQENGQAPTVEITGLHAEFLGLLDLLQDLQEKVGLADVGPEISVTADEIVASYSLPVEDVSTGAFVLRNLEFHASVTVPFHGEPVSVAVGFASRANPFNLSVMALGGGGYVDLELDHTGLRRLEISLEFGATVAVAFKVASGEAHVLGGIRYEMIGSSVRLTGFLRIGGSLEVLGLVSVSVELLLALHYQTTGNRLVGRATLVIEVDLTLLSESVELDSGEWTIAGDDPPSGDPRIPFENFGKGRLFVAEESDPYLLAWLEHRAAFEEAP